MEKKIINYTLVITLLLALILLFFDYRYGLSIVVGSLFSSMSFILLALSYKKMRPELLPLTFIFRLLLLIIPFALCYFFRDLFNVIAVFVGMMINRVIIFIYSLSLKRKED